MADLTSPPSKKVSCTLDRLQLGVVGLTVLFCKLGKGGFLCVSACRESVQYVQVPATSFIWVYCAVLLCMLLSATCIVLFYSKSGHCITFSSRCLWVWFLLFFVLDINVFYCFPVEAAAFLQIHLQGLAAVDFMGVTSTYSPPVVSVGW